MFKSLPIIFFLLSMLNIYSQDVIIGSGGKMIVGEGVKVDNPLYYDKSTGEIYYVPAV